jgi:PAS domain S-box
MNAINEPLARISALEHELLLSKRQYQFLYDNAPYMYVSIDDARNITDCNAFFCRTNGLTKQQIVGTNIVSLFKREDRSVFEAFLGTLQAQSKAFDSPVLTMAPLDGSSKPIHVALSAAPESNPLQKRDLVLIMQDISRSVKLEQEQRNARMQMYLSARLASIGTLASGVAHELNNPLTAILGFSNALLGRMKENTGINKEELSQ